jgi:hypothetical protein
MMEGINGARIGDNLLVLQWKSLVALELVWVQLGTRWRLSRSLKCKGTAEMQGWLGAEMPRHQ